MKDISYKDFAILSPAEKEEAITLLSRYEQIDALGYKDPPRPEGVGRTDDHPHQDAPRPEGVGRTDDLRNKNIEQMVRSTRASYPTVAN